MKRLMALALMVGFLCFPVSGQEKLVVLTFDDGPSGKYTSMLLDGLAQRDVPATFLLCGYRMEQYPELTQRICQDGHEIGLHGYSHRPMQDMCSRDVTAEFEKALALVPEGCPVQFLRSPGGVYCPSVEKAAKKLGLSMLFWSVDPRDWATHDVQVIEKEVIGNVKDGDVILLHDMSDSSVEAALTIVDQLREQGFRFVTASQLAAARGICPEPGAKYTCFPKNTPL